MCVYLNRVPRFDVDVDRFVVVIVFIAVMPGHIYIYISTMTVDVGKHVMRICHTDYDQHTGNDYCLIVAFWSNSQLKTFWFNSNQWNLDWEKNSTRLRTRDGKKAPPKQQKFHDNFFLFRFREIRYQNRKFWHLIAAASPWKQEESCANPIVIIVEAFFSSRRYARSFHWIFMLKNW